MAVYRRRRIGLLQDQCEGLINITSIASLVKPPICDTGIVPPPSLLQMIFEDGKVMQYEDGNTMGYEGSTGIPANWFDTDWKERIPFLVNNGVVPSTQTNFPFLIKGVFSDLIGKTQLNGKDLRIAGTDKVELDYEIVRFIPATGELILWCKVLSLNDGTEIFLYFANSIPVSDNQNPPAVWAAYTGVYHWENDSFNSSTSVIGTPTLINFGSDPATGKIGDARKGFASNTDFVDAGNLPIITNQNYTISFWVNPTTVGNAVNVIYGQLANIFFINPTEQLKLQIPSAGFPTITSIVTLTMGQFAHVVVTHEGTGTGQTKLFINGVQSDDAVAIPDWISNVTKTIGVQINLTNRSFDGIIGEFNYSVGSVKTPDFIKTQFNNQNIPTTFYTVGIVQVIS